MDVIRSRKLLSSSYVRTGLSEVAETTVSDGSKEVAMRQGEGESVLVGSRDLTVRHAKRIDIAGS